MTLPELAKKYVGALYLVLPTQPPPNRKAWYTTHLTRLPDGLGFDFGAVTPASLISPFYTLPEGGGITVVCPHTLDPDTFLIGIDVDVYDPVLAPVAALRVAGIIAEPGPTKTGEKGLTVFGTTLLRNIDLQAYYKMCRGVGTSAYWLTKGKIKTAEYEGHAQGIDIIGTGSTLHSVLPPTVHPNGQEYKWIPFPGTDVILRLEDVPLSKLPVITRAQLMLMSLIFQPGFDKVWLFVGGTSDGNFNDLMRDATLILYHNGFPINDILEIALREARRSAPNEDKYREREAVVRGTVLPMEKKFPDKKPTGKKPPKVHPDRECSDWLLGELKSENCARFNGEPYRWDGSHWISMNRIGEIDTWYTKIQEQFAHVGHSVTEAAIKATVRRLLVREASVAPDLIPFANGVVHVPTGILRLEEQDDNFVGFIPHNYNPDALCPKWDLYVYDLLLPPADTDPKSGDHEKAIAVLTSFLGYILTRSHRLQKFLLLIGKPGTGKSVLTKILKGLLPKEWVSEVALNSFSETNSLRRMSNSLINVSSEAGRGFFTKTVDDVVLRITSGEPVEVKTLFQDSISIVSPSRLIINGNIMPDFNDSTGAVQRRSGVLRTTDIRPDPIVPEFEKIILEEAEGILAAFVRAYRALLARGGEFILPSYSIAEAEEMTRAANSVTIWRHSMCTATTRDEDRMINSDLYADYKEWCEYNGYKPFASHNWGKELTRIGFPSVKVRMGSIYPYMRGLSTSKSLRNEPETGAEY